MRSFFFLFCYQLYRVITLPIRLVGTHKKNWPLTYWFHAHGEGELLSLKALITTLQKTYPHARYIVTTATEHFAQQHLSNISVMPLNSSSLSTAYTMLSNLRPTFLIMSSCALPSSLILLARFFSCRVIGIDTQLPLERKARIDSSPLLRWFYRNIFDHFDHIFSNTKEILVVLGIPAAAITALPSTKIVSMAQRKTITPARRIMRTRPVLLVGSLHRNELSFYISLYHELSKNQEPPHLMLVPRFLDWQDILRKEVKKASSNIAHLTRLTPCNMHQQIAHAISSNDISLICQIGVLFELYQYATIFYLGGTFNKIGGHNVMEPALWQLPIITGPNLSGVNQPEAPILARNGGLKQVASTDELITVTQQLLHDTHHATQMARHNYDWIQIEQHAAQQGHTTIIKHLRP